MDIPHENIADEKNQKYREEDTGYDDDYDDEEELKEKDEEITDEKKDLPEKSSPKIKRQKRHSYLERAFRKPKKKKVEKKESEIRRDDSQENKHEPEQTPGGNDKDTKEDSKKLNENGHENLLDLDISEEAKPHVVNIIASSISSIISTAFSLPLLIIKKRLQLQNYKSRRKILQEIRVLYAEQGVRGFWKGHTKQQFIRVFQCTTLFWTYNQLMISLDKVPDDYELLKNFTAGFCSGGATTFVSFPIEQLRLRIMAIVHVRRRFSAIHLRPLLKFDPWHMFYRGMWPHFLHTSFNYGFKFLFYNMVCDQVFAKTVDQERDEIPSERLMMAGASSGILAHSLTYPMALVRRKLEERSLKRQAYSFDNTCRSLMQCFILVLRTDGLVGLYRGFLPVLMRTTVNSGIMFAVFDKMHKYMQEEI